MTNLPALPDGPYYVIYRMNYNATEQRFECEDVGVIYNDQHAKLLASIFNFGAALPYRMRRVDPTAAKKAP